MKDIQPVTEYNKYNNTATSTIFTVACHIHVC